MDEEQTLEALSNVLSALSETPFDLSLHAQHIQLAAAAGMDDQAHAARETLTTYYACADDVWLPLLEEKKKAADINSIEGVLSVLQAYNLAGDDYLSIPLLRQHMGFLIERHAYFSASSASSVLPEDPFSREWTREVLNTVVARGVGHITQGHLLWDALRDWEIDNLSTALSDERSAAVVEVEDLYLERLQKCHSTNEETFQSYSTFTTNYKAPQAYETLLVNATKIRGKAKKAYEWREPYELALEKSGNSLYAYQNYVAYELRAKQPDLDILSNIHERAIAEAAKRRAVGEAGAEEALRLWWASYVDSMRRNDAPVEQQLSLFRRSIRSVPGSGEQWAKYIRFLEVNSEVLDEDKGEPISVIYDKAFATKLLQNDVEGMIALFLARAGFERRICLSSLEHEQSAGGATLSESAVAQPFLEPQDRLSILLDLLNGGIKTIRSASNGGDSRFRLERFLFALHHELEQSDEATKVWADTAKHYKTAYIPWLEYTSALERLGDHNEARKVFTKVAKSPLDWPEMLWEAWLSFEHSHGSAEEVQNALDIVERARTHVEARRAKEAEKAGYQATQVTSLQQAGSVPVELAETAQNIEAPMDIDEETKGAAGSMKRKAEEEPTEESKKPRVEQTQPLKRDRENCTVFVGDLPAGTSDDDLTQLFKDCGVVREVKITQLPNILVATVEFMSRDSVPAALTKDKKRVHNHEINVHLAWESTLYVTNFPESADDASIRKLFAQYGHIFDVRWPSKKFKSTRRFCYVQYTSPTAARLALELHGRELEPGHSLNVYISNPERRKERTDADANAREVYVAGLSKFVTKDDLTKLFRTYGPVKEVRMALNNENHSKGFAFIEFEEEKDAVKALGANNYELKKRRIAVTQSDPRVRSQKRETETGFGKKADARSRSLRIRDLPDGTQVGLLQQAVEKLAPVNSVDVLIDKHEAVVEFQSQADAARLLLNPDPFEFNGAQLRFSDSEDVSGKPRNALAVGGAAFVPRNAASRPRAGLGRARNPPPAGSQIPSDDGASPRGKGKAQDDFRKMLLGGK
ncbi:RNA-binding protein Prp24 [Lactarius quietus]|nr:RNA-binding protein Prp24 [Lactarius quietus]